MYADTFEPFREFFRENESLDLEAIKEQDHGEWIWTKSHKERALSHHIWKSCMHSKDLVYLYIFLLSQFRIGA